MKIHLKTAVKNDFETVFNGFNNDLLLKLTPPGMKVTFIQVDPEIKPGAVVHLEARVLWVIKQEFYNVIVEREENEEEKWFVDVGKKLPGLFRSWNHKHLVRKTGENSCEIVDDIDYRTPFKLLDYLMYPFMWAQFAYRRPVYRKVFNLPGK